MGLLRGRPLALFCTCFLVALFVASYVSSYGKILCGILFLIFAAVFLCLTIFLSRHRATWIALLLCALSVSFAFFHMYLCIDRREAVALDYTGKRTVECQILSENAVREGRSEYVAELWQIGEDRVRIRTYLICGFSADLHAGDRIAAHVELMPTDEETYGIRADERVRDENILLTAVCHDSEDGALLHCAEGQNAWELLFEKNGIRLVGDRMRVSVGELFTRAFGKEIAPLARSFFAGDKSALDDRTVRDFRRTGTSHLLAVSGLHIAILLGGLEWLLRKLTLHKRIRIAVVFVAAIFLLMLTGFSMSACRSVLMLSLVYACYCLAKENDALTSLLVAVCVILIVSAEAFWDLGLWMSFLATLGLLTVYPLLDAKIPRTCFSSFVPRLLWRIGRAALMTVLMSAVSGLFLLPIQWSVFRELSLVTLPANLMLAPLGTVFLYAILPSVLLSAVPWLGTAVRFLLSSVVRAMTGILGFFSNRNFATVSLEYRFADVIIPLLAAIMLILLLVTLRRKLLVFIPPLLATVAFCVCLFFTFAGEAPVASYYKNGSQRMIAVTDDGEAVLCDLSTTKESAYYDMARTVREQGATDVDALVLAHLCDEHPDMLEAFLQDTVVHRLCLPQEQAKQKFSLAREVVSIAEEAGCEVVLYSADESFSPFADTVILAQSEAESQTIVSLQVRFGEQGITYAVPTEMSKDTWDACVPMLEESHTVILFAPSQAEGRVHRLSLHGEKPRQILLDAPTEGGVTVDVAQIPIYRYPADRKKRTLVFSLAD